VLPSTSLTRSTSSQLSTTLQPHPPTPHQTKPPPPPQVQRGCPQSDAMLEAVQNHTPDVVIVDEISTPAEAHAARQVAQRGVILVATAHGMALNDVMRNPDLVKLVGGVAPVTLGDASARRRCMGARPGWRG